MIKVTAEIREGKIVTRSRYYPEAAEDAKRIPGAKWNPDAKVWEYPLSMTTCKGLRKVHGDMLVIGDRLHAWAATAQLRELKQVHLGKAKDATLKIIPRQFPDLAKAMDNRPYQKTGTKFAAEGRCVALLDEVGLGKTIISIAGVIEAGNWAGDHLVIAKKTALSSVWENQLDEWTKGQATVFVCEGTQPQRKKIIESYLSSNAKSKWLIINAAMLRTKKDWWCRKCKQWMDEIPAENLEHYTEAHSRVGKIRLQTYSELQNIPWRAIIADEAHEYLSTAVKSRDNTTQEATGLLSMKTTGDCVRFALTGTPDRGRELNLWGLLYWLHPKKYSSRWAWIDEYFEKTKTPFGIEIGPLRKEMEKDFWRMLDVHTLRRTRKEVRPDVAQSFPPMIEWVPLEGKHRKQYMQLLEEGRVDLKGGEIETMSFMAEFVRQQQLAWGEWEVSGKGLMVPTARSPKLERLLDMLAERGINPKGRGDFRVTDQHFKYIIASQFTQLIDFLEGHFNRQLQIPTLKITGAVTAKRRTEAVHSFQTDNRKTAPRLLLLNTKAGGASITLDRHCEDMFILDQTYKVDDQTQLHGRIDNRSVTAEESVPRSFIYIHTKDTIERKMAEGNASQREMQHRLYDARRGVDLARMVLGNG